MIEKMKVVHIVAAASEKTALLDRLRALGIVHFGEKASADQRHLERFALACVRAGKEPADVLAGLALSYFGGHGCAQADSGRVPLLVFLLLWIYAVFSFSMYAIPLAAQLDLPLRAVFRNALILLLARSGQNVAALLVVAACTLLLVLTAPFLLPLVLFAHFSFCALVCLCFAEGGLRRCIAE